MVGGCVASSMVAVLLCYTCDVLQCWRFPQAKSEGGLCPVEKRKSHTYMETFSPLWEHELTGIGFFSTLPYNSRNKHCRYRLGSRWHISPPLFCLPLQPRIHHPKMVMLIRQRISTLSSFLRCSFSSVCYHVVDITNNTSDSRPRQIPGSV